MTHAETPPPVQLPYIGQRRDAFDAPGILDGLIDLARFELTAERKAYLERELNSQRKVLAKIVEGLAALDVEGVTLAPMTHGVPYAPEIRPALREDEVVPFADVAQILANAPQTSEGFFVVPPPEHSKLG